MADHYETLQLSPSADRETVERVYRLLAKRYHPDNPTSGDATRFAELREAYGVLSDPDARAAYDARYEDERRREWALHREDTAAGDREQDRYLFHSLLSVLYVARRRDPEHAGLAPYHLERMLGLPQEHLQFPIWYLKKRGFVEVQHDGLLAITVDGIDELGTRPLVTPTDHRIEAGSGAGQGDADFTPASIPRKAGGM